MRAIAEGIISAAATIWRIVCHCTNGHGKNTEPIPTNALKSISAILFRTKPEPRQSTIKATEPTMNVVSRVLLLRLFMVKKIKRTRTVGIGDLPALGQIVREQ